MERSSGRRILCSFEKCGLDCSLSSVQHYDAKSLRRLLFRGPRGAIAEANSGALHSDSTDLQSFSSLRPIERWSCCSEFAHSWSALPWGERVADDCRSTTFSSSLHLRGGPLGPDGRPGAESRQMRAHVGCTLAQRFFGSCEKCTICISRRYTKSVTRI